jgi:hypothetical protein
VQQHVGAPRFRGSKIVPMKHNKKDKFQKHGISYGTKNKWMEFKIRKKGRI